ENLTTTASKRLSEKAHIQLDQLFGNHQLVLDPASKPEQGYAAVTPSGLSMYGKIDRIDHIDENTIRIVDYKTGKRITNPASKSQDTLLRQWRHRLQLGFYILLIRQQRPFAAKHIQAQIIQLDAATNEPVCLDYTFDDADIARIEQLALAVFRRIKAL